MADAESAPCPPEEKCPDSTDDASPARYDERRDVFAQASKESPSCCKAKTALRHECAGVHEAEDRIERAVSTAARSVYSALGQRFFGVAAAEAESKGQEPPRDVERDDPAENAQLVKATAKRLGADLVGICRLNPAWVYSHDRGGDSVAIPETHQSVVVMAVAMDAERLRLSPRPAATAATLIGYMRMAICAAGLAQFIRGLGYRAIACGNDTALSIPLAVDAGLGEMGRHGSLITDEFGPGVRLCKVITNLPLEPDPPVDLGVEAKCRECQLCVEACPAGAIDGQPEPSVKTASSSNNAGPLRWPVDGKKCHAYWQEIGGNCATCIPACPFQPR